MYRPRFLVLAAVFALAACKIEPTPRDYIDRSGPAAEEREAAREELRSYLNAFASAVDRGDAEAALAALAAAPDAWLIGPAAERPLGRADFVAEAVRAAGVAAPQRYELAPHDVRVAVGPRATSGWFVVRLAVPAEAGGAVAADTVAAPAAPQPLWLSGVYQRREGEWELVQAHLSAVAPESATAADSAAAPAVSADSAASNPAARSARSG